MKRSEWADDWWERSALDLRGVKSLKADGLWDLCILHCQQAAEKALKALWTDKRSDDPPRTHRVGELALRLGAPEDLVRAGNALFGDYETSRYPAGPLGGASAPYTSEDVDDRLQKAEAIIAWAESQWEAGDETKSDG
jgi:HEPN domain-containing protein